MVAGNEKRKRESMSLEGIIEAVSEGDIDINHTSQRDAKQWKKQWQWDLVGTVFAGRFMNPLVVCEEKETLTNWLIDGKQRISTLIEFRSGKLKLGDEMEDPITTYYEYEEDNNGNKILDSNGRAKKILIEYDLRGKKFDDLPAKLKRRFKEYQIDVDENFDCDGREINTILRNCNKHQKMNGAQMGVTYTDTATSYLIDKTKNHTFFKDCLYLTATKRKDGSVKRVVIESIMLLHFFDHWNKDPNKNATFVSNNTKEGEGFDDLNGILDRLAMVCDKEKMKAIFLIKDMHIWISAFNKFISFNRPDKEFIDFAINMYETFKDTDIWKSRGTKDKKVIQAKLDLLYGVMNEYFDIKDEEVVEEKLEISADLQNVVDQVVETDIVKDLQLKNVEEITINTLMTLEEINANKQEFAANYHESEISNDMLGYLEELNDWSLDITNANSIITEDTVPAFIGTIKYIWDLDIENGAEWFVDLAGRITKGTNKREILKDCELMIDDLKKYISKIKAA